LSIRPGISVRPLPAITVLPGSAVIGVAEIFSMTLPLTRTSDGAESEPPLPSKMRTF
jgi:hypothetical protein